MRSMGDMFTTALIGSIIAVLVFRYARHVGGILKGKKADFSIGVRVLGLTLTIGVASVAIAALIHLLAATVHHAVLDSTLDYFARTGLLPDRLVLLIFEV